MTNDDEDGAAGATVARGQVSWLRALSSLWRLKTITASPRGSAVPAVVTLCVLWLLLWLGLDWWERQPEPEFFSDGIPLLGWYGLGVVALAALLRAWTTPQPALSASIALVMGFVPVPLLLMTVGAVFLEPRWFWGATAVLAAYGTLYFTRGLRMITGGSQRVAAASGMIFLVGFVVASDLTDAIPDLWNPTEINETSDQEIAVRESALFEQADRIDQALDAVQRDATPQPQGFFLGFAGVGDEKVFAQEIGLAARVIGARYATEDRQLSLINDERDLENAPLASVPGLNYALQGLAKRMKVDRDVLFLAISSHGSMESGVAVANSQFPLTDLSPEDLAEALRAAGIKWRVIIVSACYAGGFIAPLRDANTIVITAAAADRTSFGCSNDRDLTYFGEAFYRDALPDAASLRDAFDQARKAIAAREHAEGETPSEPQAYFGAEVEAHLEGIHGAAPPASAAPHITAAAR